MLSTTLGTPSRFEKADYAAAWNVSPFTTLLPYPRETFNLKASLKPFSSMVC